MTLKINPSRTKTYSRIGIAAWCFTVALQIDQCIDVKLHPEDHTFYGHAPGSFGSLILITCLSAFTLVVTVINYRNQRNTRTEVSNA